MAGDSISAYYGELLISPIPLELSFNYCSHGCTFCFANLGNPQRHADIVATTNLLRDFRSRKSLEARLLSAGYPVLISNRVDPFATSNYQQAIPIINTMAELGIPMAFQTRGATVQKVRGEMEACIAKLPPSAFYISINTDSEELKKTLEPGSPTLQSRFEFIDFLKANGHKVNVGLNPCVREWVKKPKVLLKQLKKQGVHGVWLGNLHFNYKQIANMSERGKAALEASAEGIIKRSQKRHHDASFLKECSEHCRDVGLEPYCAGFPEHSEYWSENNEIYPKRFPLWQDLINFCYEGRISNKDWFSVEEVSEFLANWFPVGTLPIDGYIRATTQQMRNTHNIPSRMTYNQLMKLVWSDSRTKFSPILNPCFTNPAVEGEKGWEVLVDENKMPYLQFDPIAIQNVEYTQDVTIYKGGDL